MQSCLLVAGLMLLSQVGGAVGSRYNTQEQETNNANDDSAAGQPQDILPITPRENFATQPLGESPLGSAVAAPAEQTAPVAQPESPSNLQDQTVKPVELLSSLMQPPVSGRLAGELVTLTEAVSGSHSRAEQTQRVQAYWDLSSAVTDYYLTAREATELETLRQSVMQPSLAWDEARRALTTRTQVARRLAEAAQHRLHRILGRSSVRGLPLPSDSPHCGAYDTRYEENFAGRESADARQLDELLPLLQQRLRTQAALVAADESWRETVHRHRDPQSDGTVLLKAQELLNLSRREFVQSVREYNIQIARYTEMATPGQVGTDRLVAMLIESPSAARPERDNSAIERTSAEEAAEPHNPLRSSPRTFAEEDRSLRPQKPKTDPNVERSILVQPE